jgi:putative FmdB family regulatory protein
MPLFDFDCPHCNYTEEHIFFSTDIDPFFTCPKCKSVLRKSLNPTKFSFNFSVSTGVWEKDEKGQERYKGRGGPRVAVHKDGTPIES